MSSVFMLFLLLLFEDIWLVESGTIRGSNFICNTVNECRQDYLLCDANKNCTITCTNADSCRSSIIVCPINANCIINCAATLLNECYRAIINATASTSLYFNCEQSSLYGCEQTTVYCPNNGYSGPVTCNIAMKTLSSVEIDVYAVEGFNDVEITGSLPTLHMHCAENYQTETTCSISNPTPSPAVCSACQNIFLPTKYPTNSPSYTPTIHTTSAPTTEPTMEPTFVPTIIPTIEPTTQPTIPTIYPTNPSMVPTQNPTISPTPSPTLIIAFYDPTFAPTESQHGSVDTFTTDTDKNDDNKSSQNNAIFSRTSNVVILVLSVFVFLLFCVIGIFFSRKYQNKRKRTNTIVIQMNSPNLDTEIENIPAAVEMGRTSMSSNSDIDNFDLDEGEDILMNTETPQYDEKSVDEDEEESSLTLKHQNSNVYKVTMNMQKDDSFSNSSNSNESDDNVVIIVGNVNADKIKEKFIIERDDSDDDVMHGLTDVGDAVVNTPKQPEIEEYKEKIVQKMKEIDDGASSGDDAVLVGITDNGGGDNDNDNDDDDDDDDNDDDDESQNEFGLGIKIDSDLIDMDGLTDIGDLVVGI